MAEQTSKSQNLDLAGIFHYVLAVFVFLSSLAGLIFLGIGTTAILGVLSDRPHDMNIAIFAIGLIFFLGPLIFMGLMWTLAVLVFVAGKRITQRTHLGFCQFVAGLECLFAPFGTILGIVSLILLMSEEVRKEFH